MNGAEKTFTIKTEIEDQKRGTECSVDTVCNHSEFITLMHFGAAAIFLVFYLLLLCTRLSRRALQKNRFVSHGQDAMFRWCAQQCTQHSARCARRPHKRYSRTKERSICDVSYSMLRYVLFAE